ncbi:16S rRNA (cytosine(1402)-N(4))-methyltransferase RsmH, partial [bacterium]|nr:16S rRNA (cytosine(1402)-N(4))-methyltransferase RsmH [bacterium]
MVHIPVLQKEVLEYLDPKPNENFIDATIGNAGHTLTILERNIPAGKVLGIDADPEIIKNTKYSIQNTVYKNRVILVCDNFANLKEIVKQEKFKSVQGILFDLGMSSWHLEESGRGFSFLKNESLDMRYNPRNPLTAARIVNYYSSQEIEKILKDYGEERFAKKIAQKIIEIRKIKPIETTSQLAEIVKSATPHWYHRKKIHPATRTFQAIRIAVNDELNNLERALPQTLE